MIALGVSRVHPSNSPSASLSADPLHLNFPMAQPQRPQVQPCRYKTGKTLGAGSYSVVKECVHIDTGRYYAAKVINKRLMAGREHMVGGPASASGTMRAILKVAFWGAP